MISGIDIVCLSTQDWNEVWTRKQRFMRRFAEQGNRVLYVEAQVSAISAGRLRLDPSRPMRFLRGPRRVVDRLWVATLPLGLPFFQMAAGVSRANNVLVGSVLRRWMRRLRFNAPLLWTYAPYTDTLVGRIGERLVIYECVDEFSASKGLVRGEVVQQLERRLMKRADVTIVTHPNLLASKAPFAREIHLVPNAADVDHFARATSPATSVPDDLAQIPKPVIGFLGSVQYWLDFDLLRALASARTRWSFVFVGPVGPFANVQKIQSLPNVHFLGRRPYESLPGYLKGFDVCINPYLLDDTARNCSPLKLYEYLAAGRPVVSVAMPEAEKFADVVAIAGSVDEFLGAIDAALHDCSVDPAGRMRAVEGHSWDARFSQVEAIIERLLRQTDQPNVSNTASVFSAAARHE